jgi:UDP-GlcNAc:undecaprenyl-phosphate GlcNAc-1-phosphate transferase
MGDSGSQLLGFSAVTLSLALTQQTKVFSTLIPLLIFGLPILDTLTVMTQRIIRGCSPFLPDRSHFHHRLLKTGLFHTEAVLAIYLIQVFLLLLTFFLRYQSEWFFLSTYFLFCLGIFVFFHYANRDGRQQTHFSVLGQVKSWFKTVQGQRRVQVVSFFCLTIFLYSLMFLSSLFPTKLDRIPALLLAAVGGSILLIRHFRPEKLSRLTRTVFYLIAPFAVYLGDRNSLLLLGSAGDRFYIAAFVMLLLLSIVISAFSTRKKGIGNTPLDFLVLLLMLVLPNLPGISLHDQRLGLVGLKWIIFIISFEVLMAEKRGMADGVSVVTALSLFAFALKSSFL